MGFFLELFWTREFCLFRLASLFSNVKRVRYILGVGAYTIFGIFVFCFFACGLGVIPLFFSRSFDPRTRESCVLPVRLAGRRQVRGFLVTHEQDRWELRTDDNASVRYPLNGVQECTVIVLRTCSFNV